MARRPHSLRAPYSAYYFREEPEEDKELTHVGPGTPAGEYFRRFWQPVAFSHELKELPLRVRVLGEDLVLFRDLSGRIGLLELHCSHRGASLEFGRIQECGIRCCYHGWLFDVDGKVLETPGEPADSTYKDRFYHGANPTLEFMGLVFAYMGPPEKRPEFPFYDVFDLPGYRLIPGRKHVLPCNWVQVKENCMDPLHVVFLHSWLSRSHADSHGVLPEVYYRESPLGTVTNQTRRVAGHLWSRNSEFILPNIHQFGLTWENGTQEKITRRPQHVIWTVPLDNTSTMNISLMPVTDREAADPAFLERMRESFGQTGDRPYQERQRVPGDYDAQVSQRPIAIHALEHLGATDRGIILFRKVLKREIQAVQHGEEPKGLVRTPGTVVATYHCEVVQRIPPAPTLEGDLRLQQEFRRKVSAGEYLEDAAEVGLAV